MEKVLSAIGLAKNRIKTIKYLPEILEHIMTQEDAEIIAKLGSKPLSLEEAAKALGISEEKAQTLLEDDLFKKKGLIMPFPDLVAGTFKYRATPLLLLHDMTLLNAHYAKEKDIAFLDLWDAFYDSEMIADFKNLKVEGDLAPIFRVVPVDEDIIPKQEILTYETVRGIINKAKLISVQPCVCRVRTHGKNCNYPLEVCMAFGPAAKIVIQRGHGREITKAEALEIKRKATEAGLVHLSSNSTSGFIFICSCCGCCCGAIHAIIHHGVTKIGIPSRYQSVIDSELCVGCGTCVEHCQFQAISLVDEKAVIDSTKCWGCGVCVGQCEQGAVSMKLIHDKKQIARGDALVNMAKYGKQFGIGY